MWRRMQGGVVLVALSLAESRGRCQRKLRAWHAWAPRGLLDLMSWQRGGSLNRIARQVDTSDP